MKTVASVLAVALLGLAGCATPGSGGLTPGTSTLAWLAVRRRRGVGIRTVGIKTILSFGESDLGSRRPGE